MESRPRAEVTITDLARGGAGVARLEDGRVVFVPLTAPGDRVLIELVDEKKRYLQGEVVEILSASAERVVPRCSVFGQCGGCLWQHLPYSRQWSTKLGGVRHALARTQVALPAAPQALEEFPAQDPWGYRNRIQLRGEGRDLGFYARRSHDRVSIDRCEVARPEINAKLDELRDHGATLTAPYKVEVEALPGGEIRAVWNARHAALGFRQVNDEQNARLKAWVASRVTPGGRIYDLYGGAGNLAEALQEQASHVDCVDVGAPRAPAQGGKITFHRVEVLKWLKRAKPSAGPASAVLDPPREGLGEDGPEIAERLEFLGVREIVAVGCDPDSWARDLARFSRRGWQVSHWAVLDFFPHTPHVESAARIFLPS